MLKSLRWLRLLAALTVAGAPLSARAEDVVGDGDEVSVPAPPPPPPEPICLEDGKTAKSEVELAFAELVRIHRNRVSGPAGERVLEARVNELLERLVDFDQFVDLALGDAWDAAEDDQKRDWRETLEETLRRRYLKKLGSPLASRMQVKSVSLSCDKAEVALLITDKQGGRPQDVVLELIGTPPQTEGGRPSWQAFDVAVDGVSLLETWRGRFRRIYADGGIAAIDHHMRGLRDRYGRPN